MNKEIAEYVASAAFKSAADLTRLIPILKDHLSMEEYEHYRKAITRVGAIVGGDVMLKIFAEYPDIDLRIKTTIETFGKLS